MKKVGSEWPEDGKTMRTTAGKCSSMGLMALFVFMASISPALAQSGPAFRLAISNDRTRAYVFVVNGLIPYGYAIKTNGNLANTNGW